MQTTILLIMAKTMAEVCSLSSAAYSDPRRRVPDASISYPAIACEVLARRIIHNAPPEQWGRYMSMRFKHRQVDGDESDMSSALEQAIDSHRYVVSRNLSQLAQTFYPIAPSSFLPQRRKKVT